MSRTRPLAALAIGILTACQVSSTAPPSDRPLPPAPEATPDPEVPCEGEPLAMVVRGRVVDADGRPVPRVPVGLPFTSPPTRLAETGPDGRYELDLPGPDWVSPLDWRHSPPAYCVGVPPDTRIVLPEGSTARMIMRGLDFQLPRFCRVEVGFDQPAPTRPNTDDPMVLLAATPDGRVVEIRRMAGPMSLTWSMPCDTEGLAVLGAGWSTTRRADPGACDAPVRFHCLPDDPSAITLPLEPATSLALHLTRQGTPVAGATVDLPHGQQGVTGADGRLHTWLPSGDPAALRIHTDDGLHLSPGPLLDGAPRPDDLVATDEGLRWTLDLVDRRPVRVRSVGDEDAPAQVWATCGHAATPGQPGWACSRDALGELSCPCPATDAVIHAGGAPVEVPDGAEGVWIPEPEDAPRIAVRLPPLPEGRAPVGPLTARRVEVPWMRRLTERLGAAPATVLQRPLGDGAREVTLGPLAPGVWEITADTVAGPRSARLVVDGPVSALDWTADATP